MKKVLISFDSFKDCISSIDIGHCVDKSLKDKFNDDNNNTIIETEILSISDGGEGLLECLVDSLGLEIKIIDDIDIIGPLGEKLNNTTTPRYGYNKKESYAVIEMAIASGIQLVPESKRSPFNTTTYGTGQLIKHAIEIGGFKTIYIGAGGSATNDAGLGALQALGLIEVTKSTATDENETSIINNGSDCIIFGRDIININKIRIVNKEKYDGIKFYFLTDVKNPMIGKNGAVYSFSEQKGAKTENEKEILENGMVNISKLYPNDISTVEGTGAAGGLASGFLSIFKNDGNIKIINGMEFVLKSYNLIEKIKDFDLIITGEGCFDQTTLDGKVVDYFCKISNQYSIPILILCGKNNLSKKSFDSTSFLSNRNSGIEIIDLLSHFTKDQSLNNTKYCIDTLFKTNETLSLFLKNLFFNNK